jgi:hypothetical protein
LILSVNHLLDLQHACFGCHVTHPLDKTAKSSIIDNLFPIELHLVIAQAARYTPALVFSVPSLSLKPVFRRNHDSLYKTLARERIFEVHHPELGNGF